VDGLRDNDEFSPLFAFCIKGFLDKEQVAYPTYFGFSSSSFARGVSRPISSWQLLRLKHERMRR